MIRKIYQESEHREGWFAGLLHEVSSETQAQSCPLGRDSFSLQITADEGICLPLRSPQEEHVKLWLGLRRFLHHAIAVMVSPSRTWLT